MLKNEKQIVYYINYLIIELNKDDDFFFFNINCFIT